MASGYKTVRFAFNHAFTSVLIGDYGKEKAQIGVMEIALQNEAPPPEVLLKSTYIPLSKIKIVSVLTTFNPLKVQPFLQKLYSYCQEKKVPCFCFTFIWESCCQALYLTNTMIEKDHHIAIITKTAHEGLVYSILRHDGSKYIAIDFGKLPTKAAMTSLTLKLKNLPNFDKILWARSTGFLKDTNIEERVIRKTFKAFNLTERIFEDSDEINGQIIDHLLGKSVNPYFPAPMSIHPIIQISTRPGNKLLLKTEMFSLPFKASCVLDVNTETTLELFNGDDSKLECIQAINVAKFKSKKVKCTVDVDVNYIVTFKVQHVQE